MYGIYNNSCIYFKMTQMEYLGAGSSSVSWFGITVSWFPTHGLIGWSFTRGNATPSWLIFRMVGWLVGWLPCEYLSEGWFNHQPASWIIQFVPVDTPRCSSKYGWFHFMILPSWIIMISVSLTILSHIVVAVCIIHRWFSDSWVTIWWFHYPSLISPYH